MPEQGTQQQPDALRHLVADVLAVNQADVTEDSGPLTLESWTSLKHLELVVTLEESFGISLSRKDIVGMRSVAAVRATLASRGVRP